LRIWKIKKNIIVLHNSPFLTINVSQKERIKILKQKKDPIVQGSTLDVLLSGRLLEKIARDKHSDLFGPFVSFDNKNVL